jgi:beta-N-acetylhexosaminidase
MIAPHRTAPRRASRLVVASVVAVMMTACGSTEVVASRTPPASSSPSSHAAGPEARAPGRGACSNRIQLLSWSLARRAAQLFVVPAYWTGMGAVVPAVQQGAGGVIFFGSSAPTDLHDRLHWLAGQAPDGIPPLIMTDEEGGGVQRMANLAGNLPWPAEMAATMSPAEVRQLVAQVARRMAAYGVTMDLGPVLDLASGAGPDAIHTDGPRSFGPLPSTATTYGLAFAQGLEDGGVMPVVKHFPGEGQASANTDYGPASTPSLSSLEAADLLPFEAAIAAGLPAVMVGNASIPGLSSVPASLSPAVINGLLRHELGFQGLVITDSLSAQAIGALGIGVPQAAEEAIAAGADMVLFSSSSPSATFQQAVDRLVAAVSGGRIAAEQLDASVLRVLAAKQVNLCASS